MSEFVVPYKLHYFNSERRDVCGGYSYDDDVYLGPGINTEHFILDGTGTDASHQKDITLFTWANGVRVSGTYYSEEQTNQFRTLFTLSLIDKNGDTIMGPYYPVILSSKQYSQSLSAIDIYYTPSFISYPNDGVIPEEGNVGGFIAVGGTLYGHTVTATPYEIPDYNSNMSNSDWINYYNTYDLFIVTNKHDFDSVLNTIVNGGDGTPITPMLPEDDTSEPGGGEIDNPVYDPFSDPVDFPGLPTGGSAIASGFIRVYNPTSGQLQSLANKLWSNDFINTIHKIMNDPMEAMISLHSVPFQIVGGGNANIEVGNFDTEVSAKTVTTQYYTLDCGNISLPEHWASALDYSPYTTVDIFIPFVGVRPLQIDDVMNKVLNLKYNIDVLTGCAVAMLKCGDSVLYTYNTQVHTEIPYTMSSYGRLVQSIIGVAGTAVGATAGGAGAIIGGAIGGALGTAMTKHSDISRGGSLGGAVGVMGDFTPYLIIHRPMQSLASGFASKKGYPSNISATLSSVSGYTVVDKIHLTGIDCTDTERDEIHALLKEGVII